MQTFCVECLSSFLFSLAFWNFTCTIFSIFFSKEEDLSNCFHLETLIIIQNTNVVVTVDQNMLYITKNMMLYELRFKVKHLNIRTVGLAVYVSFECMLITHSILQGISNRKLNNQAKSQ